MPPLRGDLYSESSHDWVHVHDINAGDRDGTLSDNGPYGRDLYLFGVDPINNQGYILKSEGGVDVADSIVRSVDSLGFIAIAALNHTESFELEVKTDISAQPRKVRFTYLED